MRHLYICMYIYMYIFIYTYIFKQKKNNNYSNLLSHNWLIYHIYKLYDNVPV